VSAKDILLGMDNLCGLLLYCCYNFGMTVASGSGADTCQEGQKKHIRQYISTV
jgi:hypothetical protein